MRMSRRVQSSRGSGGGIGRLIIGLIIAGIALFSYLSSSEVNPITGENQYISLTPQQEIALGLQSAPELVRQFGGLYPDQATQNTVSAIGQRIVESSIARDTVWRFNFSVLDDAQTVNAFALPGGQVFITVALLSELENEDMVAGVLAHEIVHVLARHSAQRLAQSELTNGLVGAVAVASGDAGAAQTAAVVGQLITMGYGRDDEIQSDVLGVCLMIDAGYNPEALIGVMEVLAQASGGGTQPEFFSTHPNPDNRVARIQEAIASPEDCPNAA